MWMYVCIYLFYFFIFLLLRVDDMMIAFDGFLQILIRFSLFFGCRTFMLACQIQKAQQWRPPLLFSHLFS